jgi:pre-mRNA-processing factor SLU7
MELEEARKAGIAPAALDEDGKEINPHIPQYMTTAPWYMTSDGPTLKHQRNWNKPEKDTKGWYERGAKTFQANKYRKGACQNCGAMSHKTKDCMERPRAKGARWTNKNIAADEKVQDVKLTYDGKRDRWNGYDSRDFAKVQQRYEKIETLKQEDAKRIELEEKFTKNEKKKTEGTEAGEEEGEGEKDFLLKDEEEAGFNKLEKRVRTTGGGSSGTVRNLRIREDTAKYLLNLDPKSAHYDPKSRSMRADPNPHQDASDGSRFRGDAHLLREGEVQAWNRLVLHSGASGGMGGTSADETHLQALPSQAELLFKDFKAKKEKVTAKSKTSIEDKYGNAAAKNKFAADQRLLLGQTERYVEYNRKGQVVKGQEVKVVSRYEEDVLVNNHTAVWGSWWSDGIWGYACCHQTIRNSYCTGIVPTADQEDSKDYLCKDVADLPARKELKRPKDSKDSKEAAAASSSSRFATSTFGKTTWGEHDKDVVLDKEKLKSALQKEQERGGSRLAHGAASADEKKRGYHSLSANKADVTPEEMEAYRMKRIRADDPMLKFKSLEGEEE